MIDYKKIEEVVVYSLQIPGEEKETFLYRELLELCKYAKTIYLIPSKADNRQIRNIRYPSNIKLLCDLAYEYKTVTEKPTIKIIILNIILIVRLLISNIYNQKSFVNTCWNIKSFLHWTIIGLNQRAVIKEIIKRYAISRDAVHYDFWFNNATLGIALLKNQGDLNNFVARAHGFDLYDERQKEGMVPFREYKMKQINNLFCISDHGLKYINIKTKYKYSSKIKLNYLGVKIPEKILLEPKDDIVRVVSCSNVIEEKRVNKIFKVLNNTKFNIEWTHFGDGPLLKELIREIDLEKSDKLTIKIEGSTPNQKVLEFYASKFVYVFINLSRAEGLPVSIIEAQAYGIPVLAHSIYGIPEIISKDSGVLIEKKESDLEIFKRLNAMIEENMYDRNKIRENVNKYFNVKTNCLMFVNALSGNR